MTFFKVKFAKNEADLLHKSAFIVQKGEKGQSWWFHHSFSIIFCFIWMLYVGVRMVRQKSSGLKHFSNMSKNFRLSPKITSELTWTAVLNQNKAFSWRQEFNSTLKCQKSEYTEHFLSDMIFLEMAFWKMYFWASKGQCSVMTSSKNIQKVYLGPPKGLESLVIKQFCWISYPLFWTF